MTPLEFERRDITEEVRTASRVTHVNGHQDAAHWDSPVPFDSPDVPTFPVNELPPWLGEFVNAAAEALQVPVDLPAMLGLATLALALAKRFRVEIKHGWQEPVNLYILVSLAPGEGKSPAFRAMAAPVYEYERAERERMAPVIAEACANAKLGEERVRDLRSRAAKAKPSARAELEREYAAAVAALHELRVPAEPRLIVDDATPEAIAARLHDQRGRLGVFSAEGGPLEIIAGRYTDTPNLEIVLKAHSGDYYALDRIGRPSFMINAPALTLALTVQPEVLRGLATKQGFRGRGLLARFLYAVPRSRVGSRIADAPTIPLHVRSAYVSAVDRLLRLLTDQDHQEIQADVIALDDEAKRMLLAIKAELELRLAEGADLHPIADWANKLPGTIVRIAALLHVGDRAGLDAPVAAVPAATMARAIKIGDYLVSHALAAFGAMGADRATDDARAVLAWLKRTGSSVVSRRDIYRYMPTRFETSTAVDPAIRLLEERG